MHCQANKNSMKSILLVVAICSAVLFTACSKSTALKNGAIQIRVENATTDNFQNLTAVEKNFGSVNAGAVTGYQSFEKVVAYPGASLVTAGNAVYAGLLYCGTGPLPYLETGKYKLQIFYDNLSYSHYNARYIKE